MQISINDLTPGARKRGLYAVFAVSFLMHAGFFLIIPLASLHFVDRLGWAAGFIGLVLALRQFLQQGLTMFGGALADRFGPKRLILAGVLIRAISFVVMGYAAIPWVFLLSGVLAAAGGALFDAPQQATLATLAPEDHLNDLYGRLGIFQNVARTVGPLIGALLIRYDFQVVGFGSAAFFVLAFFITLVFLPSVSVSTTNQSVRAGLSLVLRDTAFVTFTILMMGFWFMWVQLSIAMPLQIKHMTGSDTSVGIMFTVSAVLSIALQVPALDWAQRFLRPMLIIVVGMFIMAMGMLVVAAGQGLVLFYVAVFLFSLGSVLATPSTQTVIAGMADDRARGAYFGVGALALAVGGGLGHFLGGTLVDVAARQHMAALPWLIFTAVGLVAATGLLIFYWIYNMNPAHRTSRVAVSGD